METNPSEEDFAVCAPSLPGCWSQVTTRERALANIADAIRDYLEADWSNSRVLRSRKPPAREDPRIELADARAAFELGDFRQEEAAAGRAADKAEAIGSPLLVAAARLDQCWAFGNRGQYKEARTACEIAKDTYATTSDRSGVGLALELSGVWLRPLPARSSACPG